MTDVSPEDHLEAAFAKFRHKRSMSALAAVFDAAVPSMLLLATHFTEDASVAEDIVHAAFLQVLEDVSTFDPRRPVLPWLLGITANRARDQLRSQQRRAQSFHALDEVGDSPRRESTAGSTDPADLAADKEIHDRVAEAIAQLPTPYRHLLILHLLHGLQSLEIAHSLGRPPQTVRTQLRRGLERLRRTLPRSIALPVTLGLLSSEGLAAVRHRVLLAASGTAVASHVGSLVVGTSLALLIATAWLFTGRTSTRANLPTDKGASNLVSVATEQGRGAPVAGELERDEVLAPDSTLGFRFRGICVAEESEAPLAGCEIVTRGWLRPKGAKRGHAWENTPTFQTDEAGRFDFRVVREDLRSVSLEFRSPGRAHRITATRSWATDTELATVRLARGAILFGRFVDESGAAVPAVPYSIEALEDDPARRAGDTREIVSHSSSENQRASDTGEFSSPGPLRPGDYRLNIGLAHRGSSIVRIEDHQLESRRVFVIGTDQPANAVGGTVLDASGRPVPGISLEIHQQGITGYYPATVLPDGRFLVDKVFRKFRIGCHFNPRDPEHGAHGRYRLVGDYKDLEPGALHLRVVVEPVPTRDIHVTVVDVETGEPVEEYGYWFFADRGVNRGPIVTGSVPATTHKRGELCLANQRIGRYFLSVFPVAKTRLAPAIKVPVKLSSSGSSHIKVELSRPVALRLRLMGTEDGSRPVAGVTVEVAQAFTADFFRLDTFVQPLASCTVSSGNTHCHVLLHKGITDQDGVVDFAIPPEQAGLYIRASGTHVQPIVQRIEPTRVDRTVVIPITGAFELRGRIEPVSIVRALGPRPDQIRRASTGGWSVATDYPEIRLQGADGKNLRRRQPTHVLADGSFVMTSVPPGTWQVLIAASYPRSNSQVVERVGEVHGEKGVVETTLSISDLAGGQLEGRIFVDGKEPGLSQLHLQLSGKGRPSFRATVDRSGFFRFAYLPAGSTRARLSWYDTQCGSDVTIESTEPFQIAPAPRSPIAVSFVCQRRAIRIVAAKGTAGRARLRVTPHPTSGRAGNAIYTTTREDGLVSFPCVPGTELEVDYFDPAQAKWRPLGRVPPPSDSDPQPHVLPLEN